MSKYVKKSGTQQRKERRERRKLLWLSKGLVRVGTGMDAHLEVEPGPGRTYVRKEHGELK